MALVNTFITASPADRLRLADELWLKEMCRCLGKDYLDARFSERGRGEDGSSLRRLYNLRQRCQADYLAARVKATA